ncbi:MAG: protein kinase [Deltaproteobacteria bacterium]|nr:protein kinase [Deltaproteobacteria bacterium]
MRKNNRGSLQKIGKYRILEKIGQGRMGMVFRARDPLIERELAIKVIRMELFQETEKRREAEQRFLTEARAAGQLIHPNIVTIFDVGKDQNLLYIAMEYLEGKDLGHYCRPESRLSLRHILAAMIRLCDALYYAHRHGTVHRDIKPGNIVRTTEGIIKITDFGLAKLPAGGVTREGVVLGSPSYMAPEQIAGQQVDGRTDIFALGVVLYELIMGEQPFAGRDIYSTMYQVSYEEPAKMDEFRKRTPPDLDKIVLKALAKKPDERYPDAMVMARDIKRILRIATQRMTSSRLKEAPAAAPLGSEEEDAPRTVLLSPHEIQRLLARRILAVRLDLRREGLRVGVSEVVEGEQDASPMEVRPIKAQELRAFAENTRDILEKGNRAPHGIQRLQELGFHMYQKLFGPAARKIFAASVAEDLLLYVEDRLAGVHWELIHDGHDFLCLLFNMGRWQADLPAPELHSVAKGNRRMIIAANPVDDTASVREEGKLLARVMAEYPQRVKGTLWEKDISHHRLLRMGKVNILHYAGPIQYVTKEPASTGWILKNGLVTWGTIWEQVRSPDLMFAHAWKWEPPEGRAIYSPREVATFARPLLERGGRFYLGTLHCTNESNSPYFVEPFYRELLEGASVGQAVRRSRLSLMNQMGEEFLLWSGYILYGLPTQRLFPDQVE